MDYTFRYKTPGSLFWKVERQVIGHLYQGYFPLSKEEKEAKIKPKHGWDKMVLYKKDGSLVEIANWTQCSVKLGKDWVQYVKTKAEKESGVQITVNPH